MKKILLFASILILTSCEMKDKNGNAPLIEDDRGYLVDNPDYKTDAEIEYDEKMAPARAEYAASLKDGSENINLTTEPTIADREKFAAEFKPKTAKNEISLSGKDKTTIKFKSAFNSDFTVEQFSNLNYFDMFRRLGFKKVIFSDSNKVVATQEL